MAMKTKDGGPAFPTLADAAHPGMSLRDYFAAQSLAAYRSSGYQTSPAKQLAEWAVDDADALIAALTRR